MKAETDLPMLITSVQKAQYQSFIISFEDEKVVFYSLYNFNRNVCRDTNLIIHQISYNLSINNEKLGSGKVY